MESIGEKYACGSEIAMCYLTCMQEVQPFEDLEEDKFTLEGSLVSWEGRLCDVCQILMEVPRVEVNRL